MLGEAAGPQVAQARMQLGFGLGRTADVELFEHLRDAAKHQDHAAFELRGQNCLHRVPPTCSGPGASGLPGTVNALLRMANRKQFAMRGRRKHEFPFSLMKHCRTIKHVAKRYGVTEKAVKAEAEKVRQQLWCLCHVRDFDRIRDIIKSPTLTVDPFLAPQRGLPPRAILEETRKHGILKRQVWDSPFASLDDYEKRWRALGRL